MYRHIITIHININSMYLVRHLYFLKSQQNKNHNKKKKISDKMRLFSNRGRYESERGWGWSWLGLCSCGGPFSGTVLLPAGLDSSGGGLLVAGGADDLVCVCAGIKPHLKLTGQTLKHTHTLRHVSQDTPDTFRRHPTQLSCLKWNLFWSRGASSISFVEIIN